MEIKNKYTLGAWEDYYERERRMHIKPKQGFFSFYDLFLCDSILAAYLPRAETGARESAPKLKVCEIGCGDGKLLKKIARTFGYEPYGIEYSSAAVEAAKKENVHTIQADVFDAHAMRANNNFFDVVYSYGFIEHIEPPEKAIDAHLALLKPGGYFFIQIPRLKGFNYWKFKFFRPDLLPLHNLSIMEEEKLAELCVREDTEILFCKNYGTLKLRVPVAQKDIKYFLLKVLSYVEYLINPFLRFLFGSRGFETRLLSPAVICIGRKK